MADPISIPYPFKRVTYPGIDNPEYIGDIRVATEGIMASIAMIVGLGPDDFAIISGIDYVADTIPYYTPGYFYLKGIFYQIQTTFVQNNWLVPNVQSALVRAFNDGQSRPIYNYYGANNVDADPANGCPVFVGDMNDYRVGNGYLAAQVAFMLTKVNLLRTGAFADIGPGAGKVAAGDDPRLVYTSAQLDARFAQRTNVIEKGTATAYIPLNPNDPVNKAYADATSGRRITSGITPLGDADLGGGTVHTISFGQTINVPYMVDWSLSSLSANPALDVFSQITVRAITPTSFGIYTREQQNGVQNVTLYWILWAM